MTGTELVDLASHPKRRQNFYKTSGLSQDELVVIEAIEMAEFKLRKLQQRNIRGQEMRAVITRVRSWFGLINVAMIACVLAIVAIILSGCENFKANQEAFRAYQAAHPTIQCTTLTLSRTSHTTCR